MFTALVNSNLQFNSAEEIFQKRWVFLQVRHVMGYQDPSQTISNDQFSSIIYDRPGLRAAVIVDKDFRTRKSL